MAASRQPFETGERRVRTGGQKRLSGGCPFCRVPPDPTHGKESPFAVCPDPAHGIGGLLCRVPQFGPRQRAEAAARPGRSTGAAGCWPAGSGGCGLAQHRAGACGQARGAAPKRGWRPDNVCRVPTARHTAKVLFAVCLGLCTRQTISNF